MQLRAFIFKYIMSINTMSKLYIMNNTYLLYFSSYLFYGTFKKYLSSKLHCYSYQKTREKIGQYYCKLNHYSIVTPQLYYVTGLSHTGTCRIYETLLNTDNLSLYIVKQYLKPPLCKYPSNAYLLKSMKSNCSWNDRKYTYLLVVNYIFR